MKGELSTSLKMIFAPIPPENYQDLHVTYATQIFINFIEMRNPS